MHSNSLAPVLSATRSRDSCWITSNSSVVPLARESVCYSVALTCRELLGLLEDLDLEPPLRGGRRPGLHEQYAVADTTRVLLVVCLHPVGAPHDLGVPGVLHAVLDGNHNGLVHLVAHHEALTGLAVAAAPTGIGGLLDCLAHSVSPDAPVAPTPAGTPYSIPSSRSRITV